MKIPEGKSVKTMHREYGVAESTLQWWARNNNVPYFSNEEGGRRIYIYDADSEERFNNRKTLPGRKPVPKEPKPPARRGRPRVEKPEPEWKPPVLSANGKPLGRPRKQPAPVTGVKKPTKRTRKEK
ncbi:hypothetical protein FACS189450_03300 [Spirochaetia bacterium]|nr:hypothetical protein FACS189450_03300 [Spirochaetia bacterium]